jgi:hypothetical protein
MEFRLTYRGPLAANGSVAEKQAIRRAFHPQLAELWQHEPLRSIGPDGRHLWESGAEPSLLFPVGAFDFIPVVSKRIHLISHLDILFLRREHLGALITSGGDLDNRLKTLLDALRIPTNQDELPRGDQPQNGETPFFCLLEDDSLITRISVTTDRLFEPSAPGARSHVFLVLHVVVLPTLRTWINIGF